MRTLLCSLLISLALVTPASADINFTDFSSTVGLNLLGDASSFANRLQLTPDQNDRVGAAWFATPQAVSSTFTTEFEFRLGGAPGADGFAFVIQNSGAVAFGSGGCELGYNGIMNGLAVEFDSYQNINCNAVVTGDPAQQHLSIHTSGTGALSVREATSLGSTTALPNISDGATHLVRIEYTPGTMTVFVDDLINAALSVNVDLDTNLLLTNGTALVGFTAATGGLAQAHEIISWAFTENSAPPTGNHAPAAPIINEPSASGQILNPFDVHMEIGTFTDQDAGDQHACTDWEIWTVSPNERVWLASCATGPESVHAHLGDGVYIGSFAGRTSLIGSTAYTLRVRVSDDSGDPATRWSTRTTLPFATGAASSTFPLEVDDVIVPPTPKWHTTDGSAVVLPAGSTPPSLRIENAASDLVLSISGFDGVTNAVLDTPELPDHAAVRVVITSGSTGLNLIASDLTITDHECETHTLLLPALSLASNQTVALWVSFDGSTYLGTLAQTTPVFTTLARGQDFPWVAANGFEVDVFATGLTLPVNIAFLPNPGAGATDPYFYVTELYGDIKVVDRSGNVTDYATDLVDFMRTGAFPGSGEQGLTGITVDPVSGDVIAAVLYDSTTSPGIHYPKVVRFTSNDGGRTAATQTTILDMVGEPQGQSHQISNLKILPDGKLMVHMGDGFVSSTAQIENTFRGKILRLNLDGSAASDNPFYNAANGITARDYTYALGVRNPFGGSYRHADSEYYIVENGPSVDRFARVAPGANLGWVGSDASMMILALHNWIPATGPVNIAFIEPQVFGGSGFPAAYHGRGYVTESGPTYAAGPQVNGKRISQWRFDITGDPILDTEEPFLLEYVGAGRSTAVGLAAGPDGLYMTELYADEGTSPVQTGARILRVRYVGGLDCNDNGVPDVCDIAAGTSTDLDADEIPDECGFNNSICNGDGGDQAGCTDCPCMNNAIAGTTGGCLNSASTAARLIATGSASVSLPAMDTSDLRFAISGVPGTAFCILNSGEGVAPGGMANPCFGLGSGVQSVQFDGLRCAITNTRRHGGRSADANGDVGFTNSPWGGEGGPPVGIAVAGGGFASGQTRYFQAIYRDDPQLGCMRGLNTSQAIEITFEP